MTVIISTTLHTGRQRPWAYEIPATFVDDAGGEHNIVMVFREGEPSPEQIAATTAFWQARLEEAEEEVTIEPEI